MPSIASNRLTADSRSFEVPRCIIGHGPSGRRYLGEHLGHPVHERVHVVYLTSLVLCTSRNLLDGPLEVLCRGNRLMSARRLQIGTGGHLFDSGANPLRRLGGLIRQLRHALGPFRQLGAGAVNLPDNLAVSSGPCR